LLFKTLPALCSKNRQQYLFVKSFDLYGNEGGGEEKGGEEGNKRWYEGKTIRTKAL